MIRLKLANAKYRQEGLETRPSERKKRYYRNYIIIFLLIIILHYSYTSFRLASEIDNPLDDPPGMLDVFHAKDLSDEDEQGVGVLYPRNSMRYRMGKPTTKTTENQLPRCIKVKRVGRTYLNISNINLADVERKFPKVQHGGYYAPSNCSSKSVLAIIVAYRGHALNLAIFLYNMHPILMEQQLEYQIFTIEQAGNDLFNKGRLYNVGYKEAMKIRNFRCIVFHDLELLPMYHEIPYSCPTMPRHMSTHIDRNLVKKRKWHNDDQYMSLFGGVVSLTAKMVARVNGYSNIYFGWGGEDNDMFWRLQSVGYPIVKFNKTVGVYTELPHVRPPINNFRNHLLARGVARYKTDGLSNLEYNVIANTSHHLYTHLLVDINPKKLNVSALILKWATSDN